MKKVEINVLDWKDVWFDLFLSADNEKYGEVFQNIVEIRNKSDFPELDIEGFIMKCVYDGRINGFKVVSYDLYDLLGLDGEGTYFIKE